MTKARIATVWLDGCSGCHMSFLDMDERLLAIAGAADLVYSPLVDAKEFPADVEVTLVEGAVSSEEDLHKIKLIRERTRILVSLGDCAVTANVPGMRNPFGTKAVYDRAYRENVTFDPGIPDQVSARDRDGAHRMGAELFVGTGGRSGRPARSAEYVRAARSTR